MRSFRFLGVTFLALCLTLSGVACNMFGNTSDTNTGKTEVKSGTVKVGDTAPDYEMRNQEQLKMTLSEFKGKKNVVVVFYPADFTPV